MTLTILVFFILTFKKDLYIWDRDLFSFSCCIEFHVKLHNLGV